MLWLLLQELHIPLSTATLVYCDNVSAVYMIDERSTSRLTFTSSRRRWLWDKFEFFMCHLHISLLTSWLRVFLYNCLLILGPVLESVRLLLRLRAGVRYIELYLCLYCVSCNPSPALSWYKDTHLSCSVQAKKKEKFDVFFSWTHRRAVCHFINRRKKESCVTNWEEEKRMNCFIVLRYAQRAIYTRGDPKP